MLSRPNILGIDVGSVSVSAVTLNPGKQILQSAYEFHHGKPADKLREILDNFDLATVGGIASTASSPSILKHATRYDNQVAVVSAVRHWHPGAWWWGAKNSA
jgi:activator of 2-hydroxyglutaryl-CoA dehydratase